MFKMLFPRIHLWLPWWLGGKEPTCQYRRQGFSLWSGKIPHALEQISPCATTIEPVLHGLEAELLSTCSAHYWAHAPESQRSTRGATEMRSPHISVKKRPCSPPLEKACIARKTQHRQKIVKINKGKKIIHLI